MFHWLTANVFDVKDVVCLALGGALAREVFGRRFAKMHKKPADPLDGMTRWICRVCDEKGTPTKLACNDGNILLAMIHDHMEYFHPGVADPTKPNLG